MFQTNQSFILGYSSSCIRKGPCLSEGMGLAPNRPIPADFLALNLWLEMPLRDSIQWFLHNNSWQCVKTLVPSEVKTGDRTREPTTVSFDNPIKQTKHPTFLGTWATDVNQRLVMTRTRWLLDKGQLKPWNKT